jgi:inward rectifier potassium channel
MSKHFKNYLRKEKEETDLGFGTKGSPGGERFLNKDGTVNITRKGIKPFDSFDFFHSLITMRLGKFIFIVFGAYIGVNIIFAILYFICGPAHFGNMETGSPGNQFLQLFFFSTQTLTTVGYGYVYPKTNIASSIAAVESMCGLLGFALATGILYGRFSRPKAEILYSTKMVVAPYRGISALMFRIANTKQNELIQVEAQVLVSMRDEKSGGRVFLPLKLERDDLNFLALTWTVVHPIDENSPILGKSLSQLIELDAEFLILLKAINDTYSQTVYSRSSYKANEIEWGAKFRSIRPVPDNKGKVILKLDQVDEIEKAALPVEVFS